jgi:hypothetical protein
MTSSQAPTSPPPPSEVMGVLDTLDANQGDRITLVPIGPCLTFTVREEKTIPPPKSEWFWVKEAREGEMNVELEFPIDNDPLNPGVHLAWELMLGVFDPFHDQPPPIDIAAAVEQMVEDALIEDYGTVNA